MLKRNIITNIILVCIMLVGVCQAKPAFYAGIAPGLGTYDVGKTASNVTKSMDSFSYGLFGGALWSHKNMKYGVELAGNQYGEKKWEAPGNKFTLSSYSIAINGVFRYYLTNLPKLNFEGDLGLASVSQKTKTTDTTPNDPLPVDLSGSKSGIFPTVTLGVAYSFIQKLTAGLYYSMILAKKPDAPIQANNEYSSIPNSNKVASVTNINIKIAYNF